MVRVDGKPYSRFRNIARQLKARSWTYQEIGDLLSVSRQRAQQLVGLTDAERLWLMDKLGNKCHFCETTVGKLDLHHVNYENRFSQIILCVPCHKKLDAIGSVVTVQQDRTEEGP